MTTHAYLALVACPHESRGVFFGISGGLRGRGGSLLPKGDKSRAAARNFLAPRLDFFFRSPGRVGLLGEVQKPQF